jgi:amidophosphoribosyltransferase
VPRGDGSLTHDLLPGEKGPQDACGVFGVWAPGEDVAKLTYFGLYALQHRGQESAGIAVSDGEAMLVVKDMGLVAQVFDEGQLSALRGHLGVGHCRYSTTGASVWENAQPTFHPTAGGSVALAHNGNLTNTAELLALLAERSGRGARPSGSGSDRTNGTNAHAAASTTGHTRHTAGHAAGHVTKAAPFASTDTGLVASLLATYLDVPVEEAAADVLPRLRGAFSLVLMDEHTLYAARDPQGIRPLVLGRLERG